jgi:hypothetical protein
VGSYMQTSPKILEAVNAIREALAARVDQIRSQPGLNTDAMQCLVARAWVAAKADMDKLSGSNTAATDARKRVLTAKVWGIDDVPGDRASAAISYRDAQDRAAALDTPHAAMWLLDTAERTGDELLARAIASQADTMGWSEVSDQYFATRPAKAAAFAELQQLVPSLKNLSIADLLMYALPYPSGFAGSSEYRMTQAANDPRLAALR